MAVIAPIIRTLGGGAVLVEWVGMAGGDSGDWIALTEYRDKTAQMGGTLTAVALQGTNDPAKGSPVSLFDVDNTTVLTQAAFAAGAMKVVKENPLYMRPLVTTGAAVTVRLDGAPVVAVRGVSIKPVDGSGGAVLVEWAALSAGDTGEWVQLAHLSDKTVHATFTTLTGFALEGSDDPALSAGSISTLTDVDNLTPITHVPLGPTPGPPKMCVVKQNPTSIRPNLTAGSNVVVRMVCR